MKKKMKAKAKSASKAKKTAKSKVQKAVTKKSSAPIRPLGDRVLVKPMSADEMTSMTASGILIPDTAKEKPEQGTVIAVGPGKWEDGKHVPVGVEVGDKVMFSKYGFDEVKMNGTTYYVIAEANILAVIQ